MSTKAEERKALDQIKKLIEQVGGKDSYIGMAFDGCITDAEDNIEYDYGNSMKQRYIAERTEAQNLRKERDEFRTQLNEAIEATRKITEDFKDARQLAQERYEACDKAKAERDEAIKRADSAEARTIELEQEVLKLKARLYDYMVKEV